MVTYLDFFTKWRIKMTHISKFRNCDPEVVKVLKTKILPEEDETHYWIDFLGEIKVSTTNQKVIKRLSGIRDFKVTRAYITSTNQVKHILGILWNQKIILKTDLFMHSMKNSKIESILSSIPKGE
jgi:hypothetical protein